MVSRGANQKNQLLRPKHWTQTHLSSFFHLSEATKSSPVYSPTLCTPTELSKGSHCRWAQKLLDTKLPNGLQDTRCKIYWMTPCSGTCHQKPTAPIFASSSHPGKSYCSKSDLQTQNTLFIHWTHHPKGLQCSDICQFYNQTLKPHNTHDRMTIAVSRPKNWRDLLTRTVLTLPEGTHIRDFIKEQTINN
jgi:hypothetical protein